MVEVTFTKITNSKGLLTKEIRPDGNGSIVKKSAANLHQGIAETIRMPFAEFGHFLRSLKTNQAICHGISGHRKIQIKTQAHYRGQPHTITRTKEFFKFPPEAGIGMFDHDPKPGQKELDPKELINIVCDVYPDFGKLPTCSTSSTSSFIYDSQGRLISGDRAGFHIYFPFRPANKLPEFAEWLFKKLWLAGHGYIFITKDGKMLERTIFDKTVFSPERLDFVAGAYCIDCEQHLPDPVYRQGEILEGTI